MDQGRCPGTASWGCAARPGVSKEAKELNDLLRENAAIRDYLEKTAKASTKVERGGFILIRTKGTDGPKYKVVEEVPKTPKPDGIDLKAWPAKTGAKWDGALVPKCAPFGSFDVGKLPPGTKPDPDYRVRFWWHTHINGWATDSTGLLVTGEPHPSGKDLEDAGAVGMMMKFDDVTKQFRTFIIERNGTFYETDPKKPRAASPPSAG